MKIYLEFNNVCVAVNTGSKTWGDLFREFSIREDSFLHCSMVPNMPFIAACNLEDGDRFIVNAELPIESIKRASIIYALDKNTAVRLLGWDFIKKTYAGNVRAYTRCESLCCMCLPPISPQKLLNNKKQLEKEIETAKTVMASTKDSDIPVFDTNTKHLDLLWLLLDSSNVCGQLGLHVRRFNENSWIAYSYSGGSSLWGAFGATRTIEEAKQLLRERGKVWW